MTDGVDLSTLLSALSGSGDVASRLGALLGGGDAAAKLGDALGNADLGAKLADTLKDADLSSIVSLLGGAAGSGGDAERSSGASGEDAAALPAIFGSLGGGRKMSKERRDLRAALKPFVSERRRRAIDMLLGFDRLTAFLPGGR